MVVHIGEVGVGTRLISDIDPSDRLEGDAVFRLTSVSAARKTQYRVSMSSEGTLCQRRALTNHDPTSLAANTDGLTAKRHCCR